MATQSSVLDKTQALLTTNSTQLESSMSDRAKALILDVTYDAPACKDVAEFKAAFELAEKGAHAAAKKMFRNLVELIKYCAMVRSYLSERGVNVELRKQAGIPAGFERWYEGFRSQHDIAWAYKTMLHKIAELEGGCEKCGRLVSCDSDHKKSCVLYRPLIEQAEPDGGNGAGGPKLKMKEATNAYYADRYNALIGLLTNAPADTSPQEIIETMRQEAEAAHQQLDAEQAKRIKIPKLVKLPDPDYTNLKAGIQALKEENDSLKQRLETLQAVPEALRDQTITSTLAAEPDRGRAASKLNDYLKTVVERVLPPHITLDTLSHPQLRFAGRDHRIMIGDCLEKQTNGTKVKTLAKCTAIADYEQRRRVREWDGKSWGKEHVVYSADDHYYRVITEEAARKLAPGAFEP